MKTILSMDISIDKLKMKGASLLPLNQQVKSELISLNIRVNLEAT